MKDERPNDNLAVPEELSAIRVLATEELPTARTRCQAWKGLLSFEWKAHSRLFLSLIALWLVAVWVLPLADNPAWILAFGLVYALIAGPAVGGHDILEGCEEYSFALPPSRIERFWIRFALGGSAFLVFTSLDLLALGLDLSQAVARLYVDAGLLKPVDVLEPRLLLGLVIAFPFACFALTFALAANAPTRSLVLTSWFWSALACLLILRMGLFYEYWHWGGWMGYVTTPALILAGLGALWIGCYFYRSKELAIAAKPIVIPSHWWIWTLLLMAGAGLCLFLVRSLLDEFVRILRQ